MTAEHSSSAEQLIEQLRHLIALFNCTLNPSERVSLYHGIVRLRSLLERRRDS